MRTKLCANWVINDIAAKMNEEVDLPPWAFRVGDDTVGHIIRRVREGVINAKTGKSLLSTLWEEGLQESRKMGRLFGAGTHRRSTNLLATKV